MHNLSSVSFTALCIGLAFLFATWAGNFSDYMHLEDLGLEESEAARALRSISPGERMVLNLGFVLSIFGALGLLVDFLGKLVSRRQSGAS